MGTTKYRIAYFQQDGLITGSAISLRHFLSALNRELFDPIVVLAKEGPARNLYESLNIPVYVHAFDTFWTFPGPRCFSRGMLYQLKALVSNNKLRNFIEIELKPHLVHINDKASLNVGVSLKKSGIPIIQHSRSSYHSTACKLGKQLSARTIIGYAQHVISISEDEEDGFEKFNQKSIIYNTVDFNMVKAAKLTRKSIRISLGINEHEYLIGFAAHVTEKKGAWDFLKLCKELSNNKQLKYILIGKLDEIGPTYLGNGIMSPLSPKAFVEDFIQKNKLTNQLIVTGFREDNLQLIAAMDILVVPNKNGVLGRQPIEAQALGIPVIAQKGHSNRSKIIIDGKTGYLVNDIDETITIINKIMSEDSFNTLSEAASTYAMQKFTPSINMQKIETIYQSLIKS